jgi:hypothetical protein
MGSSYSNITLHGPERERVIAALEQRGRQAYVGPAANGCVVVFDEASEDDPELGAALAAELGRELGGVALLVMVYDDDLFLYRLLRGGDEVDRYVSAPGYFEGEDYPPEGGDAALLCGAFGCGSPDAVERILRAEGKTGDYFFETQRHADLAELLGLPPHCAGLGFGYIRQGDADAGLESQLARVGVEDVAPRDQAEQMRARLSRIPGAEAMLARLDSATAAADAPAHRYFPALVAGDAGRIRALFAGEPALDDPLSGRIDAAGLDAHAAAARELFAGAVAQYVPAGMVETDERVVAHGRILDRRAGVAAVLDVACVCERAEDGRFRELRAYWTPAALQGRRGERAPVLPADPDLPLPPIVARHLRALAADDITGVLDTYDGRCLASNPWSTAEDTVRGQYGARIGEQGAVVLSPCSVTVGEDACAVEYVTTRWDGAEVPPQAGLTLFQLRGGLICGVQVFGDLGPAPGAAGLAGGIPGMQEMMQQLMGSAGTPGMPGGLGDMLQGLQQMMGGMPGFSPGTPGAGGDDTLRRMEEMMGGTSGFGMGPGDDDDTLEGDLARQMEQMFGGMPLFGAGDEDDDGGDLMQQLRAMMGGMPMNFPDVDDDDPGDDEEDGDSAPPPPAPGAGR